MRDGTTKPAAEILCTFLDALMGRTTCDFYRAECSGMNITLDTSIFVTGGGSTKLSFYEGDLRTGRRTQMTLRPTELREIAAAMVRAADLVDTEQFQTARAEARVAVRGHGQSPRR